MENMLAKDIEAIQNKSKDAKLIKQELNEKYQIPLNNDYGKEIEYMCNLSEKIEEKGMEKGIEKGRNNLLFDLVNEGLLPLSEAAKRAFMTEEDFCVLMKKQDINNF